MLPVKEAAIRLLKRIQRKTYYPEPPTSGITATLTIHSSREWHDWFNALNRDQRNQWTTDAFEGQS